MKKIYLLIVLISTSLSAQSIFINEIHYDNSGTDTNESIEIAGPAGTDLSTYSIVLYNGNGGAAYKTENLSGSIPDQQNGFGAVNFPIVSIQNGGSLPDGIALANGTSLIQFLSYEGSFTGIGGIADGVTSEDIGVLETANTPIGESLQLIGTGDTYNDFIWQAPTITTSGNLNKEQIFDTVILSNSEFEILKNETVLFPNPSSTGTVTLQTSLTGELDIFIYNALGGLESKQEVSNNGLISMKELAAGAYFVQLNSHGNTITKKINIE